MGHSPLRRLRGALATVVVMLASCSSYSGSSPSDAPGGDDGGAGDAGAADGASGGGDATSDASCAADTRSDPHDCGACGHDCLGGACVEGACRPVALGAQPANSAFIGAIVVDATHVYWSQGDTIYRCAKTGCGPAPDVVGALGPTGIVSGLARAGTRLFFTDGKSVLQCATGGCGAAPGTIIGPRTAVYGLGADDASLFWGEQSGSGVSPGTINTCAETGTCTASPLTVTSGAALLVASSGAALAWEEGLLSGTVKSCALPACTSVTTLGSYATGGFSSGGYRARLTIAGADVFWVDNAGASQCAIGGCNSTPLSLYRESDIADIAVDATSLYLVVPHALLRCPRAGCASAAQATQLATLAAGGSGAIDDSAVYFSDGVAVYRLAK